MSANRRKDELLGCPHGTASARLRKQLLFKYVQLAGHDGCYRCGRAIERVEDFSIEHTVAWQSAADPKAVFFNLETIAFSHLKCNVDASAGYRPPMKEHGRRAYDRGCRCAFCCGIKSRQNAKRIRRSSSSGRTASL